MRDREPTTSSARREGLGSVAGSGGASDPPTSRSWPASSATSACRSSAGPGPRGSGRSERRAPAAGSLLDMSALAASDQLSIYAILPFVTIAALGLGFLVVFRQRAAARRALSSAAAAVPRPPRGSEPD